MLISHNYGIFLLFREEKKKAMNMSMTLKEDSSRKSERER